MSTFPPCPPSCPPPFQLPPGRLLSRWHGEPVKALIIPTSTFTTNKRGYPVLPKPHQEFVATMFSQGVQVGIYRARGMRQTVYSPLRPCQ
jgi:hypothetical protein